MCLIIIHRSYDIKLGSIMERRNERHLGGVWLSRGKGNTIKKGVEGEWKAKPLDFKCCLVDNIGFPLSSSFYYSFHHSTTTSPLLRCQHRRHTTTLLLPFLCVIVLPPPLPVRRRPSPLK